MDQDQDPHVGNIDDALEQLTAKLGGNQVRLGRIWRDVVGRDIAAHTVPTSLREGVLRVACDSGVWATELRGLATDILQRWAEYSHEAPPTSIRPWVDAARVQDPKQGLIDPRPAAETIEPSVTHLASLSPETVRRIHDMTEVVPDPRLRASLIKAIILAEMMHNDQPS